MSEKFCEMKQQETFAHLQQQQQPLHAHPVAGVVEDAATAAATALGGPGIGGMFKGAFVAARHLGNSLGSKQGQSTPVPEQAVKPYQQQARTAMESVRQVCRQREIGIIDFVEAGETDIHKAEYRRTSTEHINTMAGKYFHFYKGLFFMELESKVRLFVLKSLDHKEGGNDEVHRRARKVSENFGNKDSPLGTVFHEGMKKKFDAEDLKAQFDSTKRQMVSIEQVLDTLKSVIAQPRL